MKKNCCVVCGLLCCAIILLSCVNIVTFNAHATNHMLEEQQIISEATIDDNFADDKVLVVLKNKDSLEFNDYGIEDFSDIDCKSVRVAFSEKRQHYKELIDEAAIAATRGLSVQVEDDIDLSKHNTIITLELENPGKQNILDAIKKLEVREDVLFVGPNMKISLDNTVESDVTYTDPSEIRELLGLNLLDAEEDYFHTITVGVIDTGIDRQHAGLSGYCGTQITASGEDFTGSTNTSERYDHNGHGSHVAGIIGGQYNEELGTQGVFPKVYLASLRVLQSDGSGTIGDVIDAIKHAASQGIRILNFSAGHAAVYYQVDSYVPLKEAIEEYDDLYDGLFVCSAGNNNDDNDGNNQYPANFDLPNIISVGASTVNDTKSSFSNYGENSVDLFAPGVDILSCFATNMCNENKCDDASYANTHVCNGYHSLSGTSMAAPFVTGVAAMLLAIDDELSPAEIKDIIMDTVDEVDALQDKCISGGRLNAYRAVMTVLQNCDHAFDYSHSTDGHTSTCRVCDYTETSRNALYVVSQTSSSITVKCSVCSTQLPSCSHTLQYTSSNNTYHRISCSTCNFALSTEHNPTYINIPNSGGHRLLCSDCGNNSTEAHTYYEASWEEFMEVGCTKCSLSIDCSHVEEYDYDDTTHSIGCTSCGYEINQAHNYYRYVNTGSATSHTAYCWECGYAKSIAHTFVYTSVDNAIYHNVNCRLCGYSGTEAHTWESNNGVSECPLCGQTNSSPVTPVLSLPPEDEEELTE